MGGSRFKRSFLIYLLIFVVLIVVVFSVFPRSGGSNEIRWLEAPSHCSSESRTMPASSSRFKWRPTRSP